MTFAELPKLAPHFDWTAYFEAAKLPEIRLNVEEPKFLQEFDRQITATDLPTGRSISSGSCCTHRRRFSRSRLWTRTSLSTRKIWRSERVEAALEAVRRKPPIIPGRCAGQGIRCAVFPARGEGARKEMVKNILAAMSETVQELDWMTPGNQEKARGEDLDLQREGRLSGQVEGLQQRVDISRVILYRRECRRVPGDGR